MAPWLDTSTQPTVAAILPVRDGGDRLRAAIRSVLEQSYPVAELILAVGPSVDNTGDVAGEAAASDPRVQVVDNPSGRTPDGLNRAIHASTSEIIVRVDAGSVLPSEYVAQAVTTLIATGAANVGAIQHAVGTTSFERALAAATTSKFGVGNATYRYGDGEPQPVDTAYLGAFRRDALEAVGGYDERFTRNQDSELNWRLQDVADGVWLDPALRVTYRPRSSFSALANQYWQYGWWRAETARKHPTSLQARQLAGPGLVLGLLASAVAALTGRPKLAMLIPAIYGTATVAAAATATSSVADEPLAPTERLKLLGIFPTIHLSWGSAVLASASRWIPAELRARFPQRRPPSTTPPD